MNEKDKEKFDDYLKYCRYYKGEEECPPKVNSTLWNVERVWIREMGREGRGIIPQYLEQYRRDGLSNTSYLDGMPLSLMAVLYNRYQQRMEGMGTKEGFFNVYRGAYS